MTSRSPSSAAPSPAKSASPSPNKWGPYGSAKEFAANMAMVLIILICATVFAFSVTVAVRSFLRRRRLRLLASQAAADAEAQKAGRPAPVLDSLPPPQLFSATAAPPGVSAECAICITEFEDGESVRVLPACQHGFHAACVETWLASSSSCPTCRRSCRPAGVPPERSPEEP